MSDVWHEWGTDLDVGPSGDLLLAYDQDLGRQRVLRRLLTNPGAYIWHMDYGGGLGSFIGEPAANEQIESVISTQMAMEPYVGISPEPTATVTPASALGTGAISVQVRYNPANGQGSQVLKFSVPGS